MRRRAEVLLLYDQGLPTQEVADQVELSASRTRYWRRRYLFEGMQIFAGSELESPPAAQETPAEESPDLQLLPENVPVEEPPETDQLPEAVPQPERPI
jgi:transposase-like protein